MKLSENRMSVRKSKQRGITFIGLVFFGILLACAVMITVRVLPTAVEYQAVQKAVQRASEASTIAEVRGSFDKATVLEGIKSITSQDLEITKEGEKVVVSFSYQQEIPLFGPAYLTLKYAGRSK
jgi:hypothetical protein